MARKRDVPTRGEVTERIDKGRDDMREQEEQLETTADDVETIRRTLEDLDFGGKRITVRSENGPENCIIDCEADGRGFYFHSGEESEQRVEERPLIDRVEIPPSCRFLPTGELEGRLEDPIGVTAFCKNDREADDVEPQRLVARASRRKRAVNMK